MPGEKGGRGEAGGEILDAIKKEFGSMPRFKEEFGQAALSVEGSGWAALCMIGEEKKLLVSQIEKHNMNHIPEAKILLIIDVFEHAYYLDYKNERARYIDAFWKVIDWGQVNSRFTK